MDNGAVNSKTAKNSLNLHLILDLIRTKDMEGFLYTKER